jgi:hypothetical protein
MQKTIPCKKTVHIEQMPTEWGLMKKNVQINRAIKVLWDRILHPSFYDEICKKDK